MTKQNPSRHRTFFGIFIVCFSALVSTAFSTEATLQHFAVRLVNDLEQGPSLMFSQDWGPEGATWDNKVFVIRERETPSFFSYSKSLLEGSATNSGVITVAWDESETEAGSLTITGITNIYSRSLCRGYGYSPEYGLTVYGFHLANGLGGEFAPYYEAREASDRRMFSLIHQMPLIPYFPGVSLGDTNAVIQEPQTYRPNFNTNVMTERNAFFISGMQLSLGDLTAVPPAPIVPKEITVYTEYFTGPSCLAIMRGSQVIGFEFFGVNHEKYGTLSNSATGWMIDFTTNNGQSYVSLFESESPSYFGSSLQTLLQLTRKGRDLEIFIKPRIESSRVSIDSVVLQPKTVGAPPDPAEVYLANSPNPIIYGETFPSGVQAAKVISGDVIDSVKGTIEFWLSPLVNSTQAGVNKVLLDTDASIDRLNSKVKVVWDSDSGLLISIYNQGSQFYTVPKELIKFKTGTPFHLAITWLRDGIPGTSGNVRVYIDGSWVKTFGIGINTAYYSAGPNITNLKTYLRSINPFWMDELRAGNLNMAAYSLVGAPSQVFLPGNVGIDWRVWVLRGATINWIQDGNYENIIRRNQGLRANIARVNGIRIPADAGNLDLKAIRIGRGIKINYSDRSEPSYSNAATFQTALNFSTNTDIKDVSPLYPLGFGITVADYADGAEWGFSSAVLAFASMSGLTFPIGVYGHLPTSRLVAITPRNPNWKQSEAYSGYENDIYDSFLAASGLPPIYYSQYTDYSATLDYFTVTSESQPSFNGIPFDDGLLETYSIP